AEGGTGHVDTRRVNKHAKPLVETVLLVENPSTRGFTTLSAQLWYSSSRLERLKGYHSNTNRDKRLAVR
ncbi:hypothetical protein, partial [Streptomyces sp. DSM 41029]